MRSEWPPDEAVVYLRPSYWYMADGEYWKDGYRIVTGKLPAEGTMEGEDYWLSVYKWNHCSPDLPMELLPVFRFLAHAGIQVTVADIKGMVAEVGG